MKSVLQWDRPCNGEEFLVSLAFISMVCFLYEVRRALEHIFLFSMFDILLSLMSKKVFMITSFISSGQMVV